MSHVSRGIYTSLCRLSSRKVIEHLKSAPTKSFVVMEALQDTEPLAYNSKHVPTTKEGLSYDLLKEGYHCRIIPVAFLGDALPGRRYMVFLANALVISKDAAQIDMIAQTSQEMAQHGYAGRSPWENTDCVSADQFLVKDGIPVKLGQFARTVRKLIT